MKLFLLFVSLVAMFAASAKGVTARFEGGDLVISDEAKRIRIAEVCDSPDETPHKPWVHCVKKAGEDYYVLATTSAYTRGAPPKAGFGGGGEEYYLIWLHIAGGEVAEKVEHRYRSFVENREGQIEGWHGPIFTARCEGDVEEPTDKKNTRQTITFTFDAKHPEEGIKEERGQPKPNESSSGG
jgi:hypothetical protein